MNTAQHSTPQRRELAKKCRWRELATTETRGERIGTVKQRVWQYWGLCLIRHLLLTASAYKCGVHSFFQQHTHMPTTGHIPAFTLMHALCDEGLSQLRICMCCVSTDVQITFYALIVLWQPPTSIHINDIQPNSILLLQQTEHSPVAGVSPGAMSLLSRWTVKGWPAAWLDCKVSARGPLSSRTCSKSEVKPTTNSRR